MLALREAGMPSSVGRIKLVGLRVKTQILGTHSLGPSTEAVAESWQC
jgi:hypothetical protein